jgi:hypothetical protein
MKVQVRFASVLALLLGVLVSSAGMAFAQHVSRDPLAGLKRAISQASAPALTTTQETDLTALITAYKNALPDDEDDALAAAREAYDAAILAGNLAMAQAQADVIAARLAALNAARLKLQAKFEIDVRANLSSGGQLIPLTDKFGADRVLQLIRSLASGGRGPGGPGGPGGHGGPGPR